MKASLFVVPSTFQQLFVESVNRFAILVIQSAQSLKTGPMTSCCLATSVDEERWLSQFHRHHGILSLTGSYSCNCVPSGRQIESKLKRTEDLVSLPLLPPNVSFLFPKRLKT